MLVFSLVTAYFRSGPKCRDEVSGEASGRNATSTPSTQDKDWKRNRSVANVFNAKASAKAKGEKESMKMVFEARSQGARVGLLPPGVGRQ